MRFFKKNPTLLLGMGITILFFFFSLLRIDFLDTLEYKFYDIRMRMRSVAAPSKEIVIVDIDNDSIEKLGRWPWPRSLIAQAIDKIGSSTPKVIGLNILYSEPQQDSGLKEIGHLEKLFETVSLGVKEKKALQPLLQAIADAKVRLDQDTKLAEAIKNTGCVVLPVSFEESIYSSEDLTDQDPLLVGQSIRHVDRTEGFDCPNANDVYLPIPLLLNAAQGIGHINFVCDQDGVTRRERLFYEYNGLYVPSYTLKLAALFLGIPQDEIRAEVGRFVYLGPIKIPTTTFSELLVGFKGPANSFKRVSFFDVISDKIPLSIFKNKLVLINPSASGIINPLTIPTETFMSLGEFSAQTIWAIINRQFIQQPTWNFLFEFILILGLGAIITFVFPRLKAMLAGGGFIILLTMLIGGASYFFVSKGIWVRVTYPIVELILGYIGVMSLQHFITETGKEKIEGESAETNRMLGISFQEQGMLDMAFDKFRKVPVDDQMKDILYNLGLDYERKRQFNKAASVYEYIETYDSIFKDVVEKKKKLMQASETMVFGDEFLSGRSGGDTLIMDGLDTRPTLGRYEVIRQLGKGAMGIVYLGQDPRINRTTAIKTVRFSDDFEPEEAESMKEKFFREAESAGTLSHPNIVTIYDAGEEKDLAYIAMEFLEGDDFETYILKGNLLPLRKTIDYVADIAKGLDYAHEKGVVHRDIKPANVMLLKNGVVKITDFGIAKITASSQTKTGVVKGTPFYMSPEQISGQKVDGRSDIFSLGVMLYQMLTGQVPFSGDSPAALMHQILNVAHPDPRKINPKIVKPLVKIIDKALEKDRENRYQRASHLEKHLRDLGRKIDDAIQKRKREKST